MTSADDETTQEAYLRIRLTATPIETWAFSEEEAQMVLQALWALPALKRHHLVLDTLFEAQVRRLREWRSNMRLHVCVAFGMCVVFSSAFLIDGGVTNALLGAIWAVCALLEAQRLLSMDRDVNCEKDS